MLAFFPPVFPVCCFLAQLGCRERRLPMFSSPKTRGGVSSVCLGERLVEMQNPLSADYKLLADEGF